MKPRLELRRGRHQPVGDWILIRKWGHGVEQGLFPTFGEQVGVLVTQNRTWSVSLERHAEIQSAGCSHAE